MPADSRRPRPGGRPAGRRAAERHRRVIGLLADGRLVRADPLETARGLVVCQAALKVDRAHRRPARRPRVWKVGGHAVSLTDRPAGCECGKAASLVGSARMPETADGEHPENSEHDAFVEADGPARDPKSPSRSSSATSRPVRADSRSGRPRGGSSRTGRTSCRRGGRRWPRELAAAVHPSAGAAALGRRRGWRSSPAPPSSAAAIVAVVLLNAAVRVRPGAARRNAPSRRCAVPPAAGDGDAGRRRARSTPRELVPGDVLVAEGDRVSADARLLDGCVEVDLSTLTGESLPVVARAEQADERCRCCRPATWSSAAPALHRGRGARAGVRDRHAHRARADRRAVPAGRAESESPLEHQVRRVAWLIAVVAVGVGLALPAARHSLAGLPLQRRLHVRRRAARRQRPRRAAADDHPRARRRRAGCWPAGRAGQAALARWRRWDRRPSSAPTRPGR